MNSNVWVLLIVRIISNFSDSLYILATIWFVKESTDSNVWIGVASFMTMLPVTFQLFYGPLIDRYSKKNLLLFSMLIQAVIFVILSTLYLMNELSPLLAILLVFFAAMAGELSYPTEHALVPSLVASKNLNKVNALFAFTYNSLDVICNAAAGLILAAIGIGLVYTVNSFTFIVLFVLVWFGLRLSSLKRQHADEKSIFCYKKELWIGLQSFGNSGRCVNSSSPLH